jgi:tetratricopeptide (TPR) repeat protein
MSLKQTILAGGLAAAVASTGALAPALAAPDGGGGGTADQIKCRQGWHYDEDQKVCVPGEESRLLDDSERYEYGRALALAGDYRKALATLDAIENKQDAMVLTMIGYSTRKLGDFEAGVAYYKQALAIEPDNLNTHEYLGEAYVSMGRDDLADVQLTTIEAICGTNTCEQYVKLADFMEGDGTWH